MPVTSLEGIYRPLRMGSAPFFGLLHCDRAIESYAINLEADYQRDHVWTDRQRSLFVGHVLEGGHVQPLIVNTGPDGDWTTTEMVDGKQRVTAAIRWAAGEYPGLLGDGREVWAKELDKHSRTRLSNSIGLQFGLVRLARKECLELYLRLSSGGVIHTDEELAKVRRLLAEERANA